MPGTLVSPPAPSTGTAISRVTVPNTRLIALVGQASRHTPWPTQAEGSIKVAVRPTRPSTSFSGQARTQAPQPSWGNIIRDGLNNLFGSPWPVIGAGLAITSVVLAFNLLGDTIRDVLDPETSS